MNKKIIVSQPLQAGSAPGVRFPGVSEPQSNFETARNHLRTRPLFYDIDLSVAHSLAAGTHLTLPLDGNTFYVDQMVNSGYATVHFQDDVKPGNTGVTVYPGFISRVSFTQLVIENVAQPGLSLRIIYGVDIDFVPAVGAALFGAVQVVDGGVTRSKAGVAFAGYAGKAPVAANYSICQLWNPANSGQRVIVEEVAWYLTAGAQVVYLMSHTAALGALYGSPNPRPKKIGNTVALQENRTHAAVALPGSFEIVFFSENNKWFPYRFQEPYVLEPGYGLHIAQEALNALMSTFFQFYVETV